LNWSKSYPIRIELDLSSASWEETTTYYLKIGNAVRLWMPGGVEKINQQFEIGIHEDISVINSFFEIEFVPVSNQSLIFLNYLIDWVGERIKKSKEEMRQPVSPLAVTPFSSPHWLVAKTPTEACQAAKDMISFWEKWNNNPAFI
jgi:hypothetical protein